MTWTKDEIELARTRQLAPLLKQKGYRLVELPSGATLMAAVKGLVIRGSTWVWPAQSLKGNAIDFFMTVEAKTFAETMQLLCPKPSTQRSRPEDYEDEEEDSEN